MCLARFFQPVFSFKKSGLGDFDLRSQLIDTRNDLFKVKLQQRITSTQTKLTAKKLDIRVLVTVKLQKWKLLKGVPVELKTPCFNRVSHEPPLMLS